MAHTVLWRFAVPARHRDAFIAHYRADGSWARLFARDPAYLGTELLQDSDDSTRFLTIDRWRDGASYAAFRAQHARDYAELDALCESLTSEERLVGMFTTTDGG